jgi:HSP20 family molecular chaperone IbpA
MTQQWNWPRRTTRPAQPAQRLSADIYESVDGDAYEIEIPVAGLRPDEIVIEATSDGLTVWTQPRQAEADTGRKYIQREQTPGPSSRVFEFPEDIDIDNVQATLDNGIEWNATATPITDAAKVRDVVEKFRAKYGADQVKQYYSKFDAAVEVALG